MAMSPFFVLSVFVILTSLPVRTNSAILAKAKLTECANDGTGDEQCTSRGVIVTLALHNEQHKTERLYAMVNAVKDPATGELLQMAKPFQVILSKSKVTIHYPIFNLDRMVNNRPWEKQIKTGSCDDEWHRSWATCGFKTFKTGERILYSQGFCCFCKSNGWAGRTSRSGHYLRNPDVICNFWTRQKSAFCMRFDPLWYGVYEVLAPALVFKITVDVRKKGRNIWLGNEEQAVWNTVSKFVISPSVPARASRDGRVRAKWVGDLDIPEKLHDLSQKYLLIPSKSSYGEEHWTDNGYSSQQHFSHIQTAGANEWLFLDKNLFDFTGTTCNKIGVYYEAFKFQSNKCYDKKGSCFRNQPYHFWNEDKTRLEKKLSSKFFPGSFGPFISSTRDTPMLKYYLDRTHNSIVNLWLDADDVIFIYNWAPGKIVEAYVGDFEALSNEGKLHVMTKNTGKVQSDYTLSVGSCTTAIGTVPAQTFTIEAGKTDLRLFKMFGYNYEGSSSSCTVYLKGATTGELFDSKEVQFSTTSTCFDFGVCGNVCDVNSTLSCKQPPPHKDDTFSFLDLLKKFLVYIYILLGFFVLVLLLKIYGVVKRRQLAKKKKIELTKKVDESGNTISVENKKQKRKVRRVLFSILAIIFLPLMPIMWCIRRWSALQKTRLLREKERLRHARAQAYEELMLFEDEWIPEEPEQDSTISSEQEETELEQDSTISSEQEETELEQDSTISSEQEETELEQDSTMSSEQEETEQV